MKRFLLAFALAVGIHALLLGVEFRLPAVMPRLAGSLRPLTLTLVAHQPARPPEAPMPEKKTEPPSTTMVAPAPLEPESKIVAAPPARPRESREALKPTLNKRAKRLPARGRVPPPVPANPDRSRPVPAPAPAVSTGANPPESRLPEPRPEAGGQPRPPAASMTAMSKAPAVVTDASPLYRVNPPPRYPTSARRRGYQGTVLIEVLVGDTGRVIDLRLAQSSGHGVLDNAALEAVRTWRFIPGSRDERPVDMWVRVPVRFELR